MVEVGQVYWSNDHANTVTVKQIEHYDGVPLVCFTEPERDDVQYGLVEGAFLSRYTLKLQVTPLSPQAEKIWQAFQAKLNSQINLPQQ